MQTLPLKFPIKGSKIINKTLTPRTKFRERNQGKDKMEKISLEAIREWVRFLRGADKVNFAILGMKDVMALVDIPLGISFLQAAVHHWNPIRHTFVFGSQELCPTVEEFRDRKSVV